MRKRNVLALELNLKNAMDMFYGCFATPRSNLITKSVLFPEEMGFEKDSPPIFFDLEAIDNNKHFILYLLGQLKDVHDGKTETTTQTVMQNYKGETWITDTSSLISFLHLAHAAKLIGAVNARDLSIQLCADIEPTYEPDVDFGLGQIPFCDAKMCSWFEDYKQRILKKFEQN